MEDFAHVQWVSDAGTDEIIQKLFQPLLATRKKKHRPKPSKSGHNAVLREAKDREKLLRRKKSRANTGHDNRKVSDDNVTHDEEDKSLAAKESDHGSRKSQPTVQQDGKSDVAGRKKKTKTRLNKRLSKKTKPECSSEVVSCDNDLERYDCLTDGDNELISTHKESGSQPSESCSLKRKVHSRTKRRLKGAKDTNQTESLATMNRKRKISVENGFHLEAKKHKHEKPTKKSVFNVSKLREVLSVEKNADQTSEAVSPLEERKQKTNINCNEEQKNLKERMQQQLKSSRFRYLNEQLYSGSGTSAYKMFKNDPDSFKIYHEGYQRQVSKWPSHPLDRIIQYIRKSRSSHVVADFGCGDARLAESVQQKVHSFDLVALKPCVTACDMAHVPLKNGTIDICVFCLSLMGTNLLDYLLEAHRVLKMEGTLLIAEVISRFESISLFIRKLEKLGFILINQDKTSKMFVFFEFKKKADYDEALLPEITLEPCVYKKR